MTRRALIPILLLFCLFSAVSCQETTTEKPVLNLVISGLQQPDEKTFFRTFVMLFESEYATDVNLVYVLPEDLVTRVAEEEAAGNVATDVVMVDTAHTAQYLEAGWMADLSWLRDGYSDRTFTTLFDPWTSREGSLRFVPVSFDVYITIYNVASLPYMPATVETVRDGEDNVTAVSAITWEEFREWGHAVKEGTGTAKTGVPLSPTNSQLLYSLGGLALAYGAEGFPVLNDVGALSAWNGIAAAAAAGDIVSASVLSTASQPAALLDTGTLWLSFGHMGPLGTSYAKNPSGYVLGPAPVAETTGKAGSLAGAWTFGILADAPHPDAARDWLEFITEPEINYLYCSGLGGVISPIEEVVGHLGDSNADRIMKVGLGMLAGEMDVVVLDTSKYSPWTSVKTVYLDLYDRLLSGIPLTQEEADVFQARLEALKTS